MPAVAWFAGEMSEDVIGGALEEEPYREETGGADLPEAESVLPVEVFLDEESVMFDEDFLDEESVLSDEDFLGLKITGEGGAMFNTEAGE